ncbi:sugar ABC transporter substrate-binding protein, partial [Singulisphaera rosea]
MSISMVLAGCGDSGTPPPASGEGPSTTSKGSTKGPKLLFITNSNADWWNAVEKGMTDGGEKFGAQVTMKRNEGTTEGQIQRLEEALSLPDIQGVAVSVLEADSPGIADKLLELQSAGKVVITIDSDGPSETRRA